MDSGAWRLLAAACASPLGVGRAGKCGGGLQVYVRGADGSVQALELDPAATVADLRRAAGVPRGTVLSFGGADLADDDVQLCDTGVSAEATVEVRGERLRWSAEAKDPDITLAEDDMLAYWSPRDEDAGQCWMSLLRTEALTQQGRWEVELVTFSGNGFGRDVIGVCTEEQSLRVPQAELCGLGNGVHGWGAGLWQSPYQREHNSTAYEGDDPEDSNLCQHCPAQGDRVGLHLDCDQGTLSFFLNGRPMDADGGGATFTGLPRGVPLYPALSVGRLTSTHRYRLLPDAKPG
eukprot:TRINITY_DN7726_c0_g1_i1.p1 TRINITY_DN7726_c0_g1~~TRINITY_DN7726_c0_g1_i1.p1  ORF type:complete len:317 (+),score=56.34 TRINITY_DN7726_c0_g1_i1:81-953(+)